jgi:two-component system, chemotaxis family, chemotaxis protein CheY
MAYDFSRLKVLVVDDNQYMRSVFREFLRALGLSADNIRESSNGEEALGVASAFGPDLIISDYIMEPMDGFELARCIRRDKDSANPFVPIILCTGYTELGQVIAARDAGVNEVLAKPITANTLYSRVRTIIEEPRQFVKLDDFFGPDRRRKQIPVEEERRVTDAGAIGSDADQDPANVSEPIEKVAEV